MSKKGQMLSQALGSAPTGHCPSSADSVTVAQLSLQADRPSFDDLAEPANGVVDHEAKTTQIQEGASLGYAQRLFVAWLLFALTIGLSAATPATPSIDDLEKQIQDMVSATPAATDQTAMRNLNNLKLQLMNALGADIAQLTDSVTKGTNTERTAKAAKKNDNDELNSLNDSLGKWATGLPGAGGGAGTGAGGGAGTGAGAAAGGVLGAGAGSGSGSGAGATAGAPAHCIILSNGTSTSGGNITYPFSVDCPNITVNAIAVHPAPGSIGGKVPKPSTKGLNAAQYSADRKTVSFAVIPDSKTQRFQYQLPQTAVTPNGVAADYYIATGDVTDISDCERAKPKSGCIVVKKGLQMPLVPEHRTDQLFQGLAGVAISGASGSDPRATFLAEGKLNLPLTQDKYNNITANWDLSAYAKIGSIATINNPSTLFTSPSTLYTNVSNQAEKIVQSYEMGGFLGWRIPGTTWKISDNLLTLNVIGGGGMLTPLSPGQTPTALYQAGKGTPSTVQDYFENNKANDNAVPPLSQQFMTACYDSNKAAQNCYVQVYPADRQQFFRYYAAGLRLMFYVKDNTAGHSEYRFPGNLDFTFGQNEYVTGGGLFGSVLHFGGEIPIPGLDYLYLNLDMDSSLAKHPKDNPPLLLPPATGTTPDASTIVNVFARQPFRDRYTVGVSFDIAHLVHSATSNTDTTDDTPKITSQPQSQQIKAGTTIPLSVMATGSGTLSYKWFEGKSGDSGKPAPGPNTGPQYTTPPDLPTGVTSFWVQVTNTVSGSAPTVNSNTADVTVNP